MAHLSLSSKWLWWTSAKQQQACQHSLSQIFVLWWCPSAGLLLRGWLPLQQVSPAALGFGRFGATLLLFWVLPAPHRMLLLWCVLSLCSSPTSVRVLLLSWFLQFPETVVLMSSEPVRAGWCTSRHWDERLWVRKEITSVLTAGMPYYLCFFLQLPPTSSPKTWLLYWATSTADAEEASVPDDCCSAPAESCGCWRSAATLRGDRPQHLPPPHVFIYFFQFFCFPFLTEALLNTLWHPRSAVFTVSDSKLPRMNFDVSKWMGSGQATSLPT